MTYDNKRQILGCALERMRRSRRYAEQDVANAEYNVKRFERELAEARRVYDEYLRGHDEIKTQIERVELRLQLLGEEERLNDGN